ncbi:Phosphoribulokinase/uridine kinase [Penicillium taxi]|uniref:Phosphoribulokinase/uridine kinase n=1 Tax=Penicillium taxi TaxID=168475 RepID=UPI002544FE6C|nr:Phosphoribulokinase/uridine kinase [Penicillium taxi]KAJ5908802.1 Phosphoribulokinase/uridine kinase [Penicillium taxi]
MASELPGSSKALIIGLSGPSSSGKTTLARLLQRIFCRVPLSSQNQMNTFIIHEDDFYHPDDKIPYTTTRSGKRVQDWDTAAAIDTKFLAQALSYVRENGRLPPRLASKEDQNKESDSGVPDSLVQELREAVKQKLNGAEGLTHNTIAFMEGFLLYGPPEISTSANSNPLRPVQDQIHLSLFLPASYSSVKTRREGRSGYVTIGPAPDASDFTAETAKEHQDNGPVDLEQEDDRPPQNVWTDPPGYVDDIVWPRYVEDHAWLLVADESVEGDLVAKVGDGTNVRTDVGVQVCPGQGALGMEDVVKWAVDEIVRFYLDTCM